MVFGVLWGTMRNGIRQVHDCITYKPHIHVYTAHLLLFFLKLIECLLAFFECLCSNLSLKVSNTMNDITSFLLIGVPKY